MTVAEALESVRRVGTVERVGNQLKLRIPARARTELQFAIEILRNQKAESLALVEPGPGPSSVGFVGPYLGQIPKIEGEPNPAELSRASAILGQAGVRLMRLESGDAVGIWSDLDSPAIRNALHILGSDELPVLYLDGPEIPLRYKLRLRRVPGEPVPQHIREAMERSPEPWKVRSHSKWRFVPWPIEEQIGKRRAVDPRADIRSIREWGASCGRGFVSKSTLISSKARR